MDLPVILKCALAPNSGPWLPPIEDWVEDACNDKISNTYVEYLAAMMDTRFWLNIIAYQAAAPLVHPHHQLRRERDGVLHHRGLPPHLRRREWV